MSFSVIALPKGRISPKIMNLEKISRKNKRTKYLAMQFFICAHEIKKIVQEPWTTEKDRAALKG